VDAGVLVEPYRTEAARTYGARPVVDLFSGPTANLPYNGYYVNSKFAQQNPHTVNAFLRALWKGAEDATSNRKDVEQILPSYTNVDPATASLIALPNFPTGLSTANVQRVADLSTKFGLIGGHFDVSSMIYSYTPSNGS
jgi:NitT/TauT family transport system substrate-binding protein